MYIYLPRFIGLVDTRYKNVTTQATIGVAPDKATPPWRILRGLGIQKLRVLSR